MTVERDNARQLVKTYKAAIATVYACPFCDHHIKVAGKDRSLYRGGASVAQMAKHIRSEHPDKVQRTA